jgi:hypothetical protein
MALFSTQYTRVAYLYNVGQSEQMHTSSGAETAKRFLRVAYLYNVSQSEQMRTCSGAEAAKHFLKTKLLGLSLKNQDENEITFTRQAETN